MRIKQISLNEWYDIPGYGGKYQINYFGNIRRALKRGYKDLHLCKGYDGILIFHGSQSVGARQS